jgi:hypothetical protein
MSKYHDDLYFVHKKQRPSIGKQRQRQESSWSCVVHTQLFFTCILHVSNQDSSTDHTYILYRHQKPPPSQEQLLVAIYVVLILTVLNCNCKLAGKTMVYSCNTGAKQAQWRCLAGESRHWQLGCKFRSRFRSLMGRNSVGTRNEAQSSGGAVSVSFVFFF